MARPIAPPLAAGATAADGAGLASAKPTNETNSSAPTSSTVKTICAFLLS